MPDRTGMVGIDEAGRGAWAGPLFVAAVSLGKPVRGLNDSKRLSAAKRTELAKIIRAKASFVGIGQSSPAEIDRHGLTKATSLAMRRAIRGLPSNTPIIIDGNINYLVGRSKVSIQVDADARIPAVMAASIIAKVQRDKLMSRQAMRWPVYGFERHVGYGTAYHRRALQSHGACQLHRLSFKPLQVLGGKAI